MATRHFRLYRAGQPQCREAQVLTVFPEIGYRYRIVDEGEIRVLLYGHYRIAYLCHVDADCVEVLGVFHGALNIDRYMS